MKKPKEHSLTGRITLPLMRLAFRAVKRNRGSSGVDRVSLRMYETNLEVNLQSLMRRLKDGSYRPKPARRAWISKGPDTDQLRPLGIPTVEDRVAQEVVRRLLSPIFEREFHDSSFGFRPHRNCHLAIERVLELHRQGLQVVLDADIQAFFDSIPRSVILEALRARIADGNILDLLERFLDAGVMEEGVFSPSLRGTPQGGVISPLLANLVLNHLDWSLESAGFRFVRYADDFVVLCSTRAQAREALTVVRRVLEKELGLTLSAEKTKITTYGKGYSFLGFRLSSRSRRARPKSVKKFQAKVRELTPRHQNLDQRLIGKLNAVIRGTANYFATWFSTCRWQFQKLDKWIRMRLRCMAKKRKSRHDNVKIRVAHFRRNWGLLTLEEFCRSNHDPTQRAIPRHGAIRLGVAR